MLDNPINQLIGQKGENQQNGIKDHCPEERPHVELDEEAGQKFPHRAESQPDEKEFYKSFHRITTVPVPGFLLPGRIITKFSPNV